MLGELNTDQIELLLKSEVIGRIGCYANKKVYVVPVTYAYDGKYIYAHSRDGMKIQMMRQNPDVCFEIDKMQNLANWQSVIAFGKYEELKDQDSHAKGMEILVERLRPLFTSETAELLHGFTGHDEKEFHAVVFRIKLAEKTGRFEKR